MDEEKMQDEIDLSEIDSLDKVSSPGNVELPVEEPAAGETSPDYLDQLMRLQAEFSNFRKRAEKEKLDAIRFGRETLMMELIGLVDILEQALTHSQNAKDIGTLQKGFEMVGQQFLKFVQSQGAQSIKTIGETFDPHLHEAMEQVDTENPDENNKIIAEFQKGYKLGDRLLRSAKVKVAKLNT